MNATILHRSQYVTNSNNLKMLLIAKFVTSLTIKIKKYLVTKPYDAKDAVTSCRENKAESDLVPYSLCMCSPCITAFKNKLYICLEL